MAGRRRWRVAGLSLTAHEQHQDPYVLLIGAVLGQAVRDARGEPSRGWNAQVQAEARRFLQDRWQVGLWVGMVDADVDVIQDILLHVVGDGR